MTTTTPDRTLAQRREALQKANDIRVKRAAWKKEAKRGRHDVAELLRQPPAEFASMKIFDVLRSQPKFGRVKADKVLRVCRVSPSKTLGGLSERQRGEIAMFLRRVAACPNREENHG